MAALAAAAVLSLAAFSAGVAAQNPSGVTNGGDPATVGQWKVVSTNSGVVPIHVAYLPGDKLYMSERIHIPPRTADGVSEADIQTRLATGWYTQNQNLKNNAFFTDAAEFDLGTNQYTLIDHIPAQTDTAKNQGYAFCSGHSQLPDGRIIVVGGDQYWDTPWNGQNRTSDGRRDIRIYTNSTSFAKVADIYNVDNLGPNDPRRELWGRWYPSVLTLPDEQNVLIMGGQRAFYSPDNATMDNPTYEIFNVNTLTSTKPVQSNLLSANFPVNMYPILYVLPQSGKIWAFANNASAVLDLAAGTETPGPSLPNDGVLGRSFPFAGTNFIPMISYKDNYQMVSWLCGGVNGTGPDGNPTPREGNSPKWYANCPNCLPTASCHSLPLEKNGAQWSREDMPLARSQPAAVNLPDGTIAIVSGSGKGHQGGVFGQAVASNGVKKVVIFDPSKKVGDANRWRVGAEAAIARHYHNTALLRVDGTIVTGGGDAQNGDNIADRPDDMNLEVYSPPYMFMSNRLELDQVPTQIKYGQQFIVTFKGDVAQQVKQVSMIRYATMTHTMNLDQRHVELEIIKYGKNKLLVKAPTNPNAAIAGNWMLWAVDSRGAPVVKAATVSLRNSNPGGDAQWNDAETVSTPQFSSQSSSAAVRFAGMSVPSMTFFIVVSCLVTVGGFW
ncbi:uncharacterized protein SPPG_07033 [Spizellomyces punctatus DAOM BR117]|uniref:Galactose oxidase-like Early set domain-containing protein n=1 Tax=Spizellomyces punctatus (strain DAOM BR117) TaxID=645134 RepID=A0A0L0H7R9_SPIPD|nr:uncharacterized protein SPPG_07033 [Spizellomyces punctatus DAOM BR117]KNC97560.1 hypothetical protein SPPG_07033 [Spizellomyces punctatus DAOM BR117]|eukprot:XP_016605600.1 hypothetical protein SPPG_07033 [Spizellomyces punctatus DAOM BR117]